MNALSPDKILSPDVSIWSKVVAWLVQKSDTTVLLFLIVYGVYVRSDSWLAQLQAGYDRNAKTLEQAVERLVEEKEKDRQFIMLLIKRESDAQK
jgi:hypothetical protein